MTDYFRHKVGGQWYRLSVVKKRREIDTPWGPAMAEVGTFIATLKGDPKHKIIVHPNDLGEHWTDEPIPAPPEPITVEPTEPASIGRVQILPGMKHYGA